MKSSRKESAAAAASPAQSTAQLIHSCQGLVRSIAWKIHQRLPRSVDMDDLIGYGQIGLAEAARDYEQDRGIQFTTYAYYRVRGAILDGLSTMSWFTKMDYNRGRYEQAANDVLRSSSADESSTGDVDWFARTSRSLTAAYVMTHFCGESAEAAMVDHASPSADSETAEMKILVEKLLKGLPEQESQLIRGIYFEGLSIKDAGERVGISKAWASRLHARTLESLAHQLSGDMD